MKRIYQGRVTKVERLENSEWTELQDWQTVLWQHHEMFQDAVNYYTLVLATLAYGINDADDAFKPVKEWVTQVENTWEQAKRKAISFPGPHSRIASILGLDPQKTGFADCVNTLLSKCKAPENVRKTAILSLLDEAKETNDLNQLCVSRLPWLCSGKGKFDATPSNIIAEQANTKNTIVVKVHECDEGMLSELLDIIDPGFFLTKYPREEKQLNTEDTVKLAEKYFNALAADKHGKKAKHPEWLTFKDGFIAAVKEKAEKYPLRDPGRKPKGSFPYAIILRYFPRKEVWDAFKKVTKNDYKSTRRDEGTVDPFSLLRIDGEAPFDYFSNIVIQRGPNSKSRAAWFEYDLAAFIESIKYPHRFYQDTISRQKTVAELKDTLAIIAGQGCSSEEEGAQEYFGFKDDHRITLIRKLVTDTLGYLGESEDPGGSFDTEKIEYSISERTLRGFSNIRKHWKSLAEKGNPTEEELLSVVKSEQAAHKDGFGSSELYQQLAKPEFQAIWRDDGTQDWHANDPLKEWLRYKEVQYELTDKERPIRFTPAHATVSPRYFIFPKKTQTEKKVTKPTSRKKSATGFPSEHIPGTNSNGEMFFTSGVICRKSGSMTVEPVRFTYSAPRLRRDQLRGDSTENLFATPWIQPMMAAIGIPEPDTQNFANTRITLMPEAPDNIQLVFPVDANSDNLKTYVAQGVSWNKQFNWGVKHTLSSLRWPHEEKPKTPPDQYWWDMVSEFSSLSVDLGQRDAGAFARLDISQGYKDKARFIGETEGKKWFAAVKRVGLFRLPGEDTTVWRNSSTLEDNKGFAFREELFGEKGRSATYSETEDAVELLHGFGIEENELMSPGWREELSFPEQNDKLLVAARRFQSGLARLHRWIWFLGDAQKTTVAIKEISESNSLPLIALANSGRHDEIVNNIRGELENSQRRLPLLLIRLANRILPLRGRSWEWSEHSQKSDCFILEQTGPAISGVQIRGQRGLSMERIEQIAELRKRFQSLNQTLRRVIGGKAPARRDDSIPDCCPDLLDKLDNMKEQRVNQTAHMILAEALGLKLNPPPENKKDLKAQLDVHGQYTKKLSPVSFIVIEDLSRYLTSQGRAKRENSRLMKWCHRAVRDKLKQLCEPFGLLVVETPAAYSSRFCSRSGVAGFRAVEVSLGFENKAPWSWLKDKKDKNGMPTDEANFVMETISLLADFNSDNPKKPRTLILPIAGGPMFIPVSGGYMTQADINAAIALGLRAISDPREWSIFPRIRTKRKDGKIVANEKRKFGDKTEVVIVPNEATDIKQDDGRNPNFFVDFAKCVPWGKAVLENNTFKPKTPLVSGKALWSTVNEKQWAICMGINNQRIQKWKG